MEVALRVVKRSFERNPTQSPASILKTSFPSPSKDVMAPFMCIRKDYEQLFGREDWRVKIIVLWKDREMSGLLARLDRKKSTIGILVQTLNL
ncbi:hypothetical protein BKA56DRAFT_590844 [Ilyonectria sp. MPI-CAGE-AT-0026]|nr:hypothetical protein BKA56DRAFT_590844 [Ilyonectria sp. MPI-CAGE-AT-0026]